VPGIFISRLVPGGLAESTGLLAVNDEVLEVNGIEVAGKSLDQVLMTNIKCTGTRRYTASRTLIGVSSEFGCCEKFSIFTDFCCDSDQYCT
jgi:hypothetical protein